MLYLGIDQHHKQLTISMRNDEGTVILKRQVSTQPDKARAFLDDVRRWAGDDGFMAVLEVCGFNDWLIALLHEYGCREVVLIHPEKRSRRKTDRRDAAKLSELLWINGERLRNGQKPEGLRRVVIPSAGDQADRQLTALRKRVGQQRTRSINKMKNILRRHNLSWQQPIKTFQTQAVRRRRVQCFGDCLANRPGPAVPPALESDELLRPDARLPRAPPERWSRRGDRSLGIDHQAGQRDGAVHRGADGAARVEEGSVQA